MRAALGIADGGKLGGDQSKMYRGWYNDASKAFTFYYLLFVACTD